MIKPKPRRKPNPDYLLFILIVICDKFYINVFIAIAIACTVYTKAKYLQRGNNMINKG